MDELSRKRCPDLQHFVVFSSISSGRGNAGQSNYGMTNATAEQIIEQRRSDGLPGLAIQWGPVGEVGMFANMQKGKKTREIFGMVPQRIASCLESLDYLMCQNYPIVSSMVVAAKFKDLKNTKNLIETMMIAMGIPDIKSISLDVPISELGMDSLGSAEIQQTLEREFEIVMTFQELKAMTLNQLQARINGSKGAEAMQNFGTFMDSLWRNLHEGIQHDNLIEEFQVKDHGTKVLIIPGMLGGVGEIWSALQHSVFILQHVKLHAIEKFDDLYNALVQDVLELFKDDETFILVGYSFGSLIAIKLCEQFEKLGKKGKLFLIDGTPKFCKCQVKAFLPENPSDEDIHNVIFKEFTPKSYGVMADEVMKNIWMQVSWEAKVEEFVKVIIDNKSKEYMKNSLNATLNRIKMVLLENDMKFSISENTLVTLIKSPAPFSTSAEIESDYGLRDCCKNEVRLETIQGDHYNIIQNTAIIDIINF